MQKKYLSLIKTRPDTWLPQLRAGGQEKCWRRSLGHLGRSCMLKKLKNNKDEKAAKMRKNLLRYMLIYLVLWRIFLPKQGLLKLVIKHISI